MGEKVTTRMNVSPYEAALLEWAAVLGPENVVRDAAALNAAGTTTFATRRKIPAILLPASREQVQSCLRISSQFRVAVYPVGSGMNWGYGSRVPAADNSVLLDLGRMRRILDFSEELAYITVEPGVTQRQVFDFLREKKSRLWMDVTGAHPECSLIGNTVERGFGHTPYADHFANTCGLEVVLPGGDIVETGFSRFPGGKASAVYRWGVGPSIDGLFSQSNLGVVTRMTIWLMPAPEHFEAFSFRCDDERLPQAIDALRPLRLNGTLRSAVHIGNDYKVLSAMRQYPWEATGGETPLRPALMEQFRKQLKIGAWNGFGALYGTRAQVAEARRLIRSALSGRANEVRFLDDRKIRLLSVLARPLSLVSGRDVKRMLNLIQPVYGLMKGIPTDQPLFSTYWRKRTPPAPPMHPDRDGCGLLWCSPISPTDGRLVRDLVQLVTGVVFRNGFEPIISLTMISERAVACVISISYDRDVPGEDGRALACHDELLRTVREQGYHPYRLGIQSMWAMEERSGYSDLLRRIKHTVDPEELLAPGRYQPWPTDET